MEERGKATTSHTVTVLFEGVRTPINALLVSFQKVKPNGLPHYPGIWKHSSVGYLWKFGLLATITAMANSTRLEYGV